MLASVKLYIMLASVAMFSQLKFKILKLCSVRSGVGLF